MNNIYKYGLKACLILVGGLVLSTLILTWGIVQNVSNDRTVTVKGFSEREVDSDIVIWPLEYIIGSETLSDVQKQIHSRTSILTKFLKKHGLDETDFHILEPKITDKLTSQYIQNSENTMRFFGQHTIMVRTSKIDSIKHATSASSQLISQGIILKGYGSNARYDFKGLDTIKPEMISEATKNAFYSAQQFAQDSKSKVGKIKRAQQGFFSIRDVAPGFSRKKNVRVVVTVEYFLND